MYTTYSNTRNKTPRKRPPTGRRNLIYVRELQSGPYIDYLAAVANTVLKKIRQALANGDNTLEVPQIINVWDRFGNDCPDLIIYADGTNESRYPAEQCEVDTYFFCLAADRQEFGKSDPDDHANQLAYAKWLNTQLHAPLLEILASESMRLWGRRLTANFEYAALRIDRFANGNFDLLFDVLATFTLSHGEV